MEAKHVLCCCNLNHIDAQCVNRPFSSSLFLFHIIFIQESLFTTEDCSIGTSKSASFQLVFALLVWCNQSDSLSLFRFFSQFGRAPCWFWLSSMCGADIQIHFVSHFSFFVSFVGVMMSARFSYRFLCFHFSSVLCAHFCCRKTILVKLLSRQLMLHRSSSITTQWNVQVVQKIPSETCIVLSLTNKNRKVLNCKLWR